MRKLIGMLAAGAVLALLPRTSSAGDFFSWNNHAAPLSFKFGNEIDAHQQSRRLADGGLVGFLYVQFTGVTTADGYRVATHGDCNQARCSVGWTFNGRPLDATLLADEMGDHPLFFVPRADIPEPGAFSHFHWLGELPPVGASTSGYALQLVAVDRFCFIHHDATAASASKTCRDNAGVRLDPGIDVASHLNIVASPLPEDM